MPGFLDRLERPRRLPGVSRQRLFNEQVELALAGGQQRTDMGVLVGRNDRRRDLGTLQQLVVVGGEEIGLCVLGEFLADLRVGVAQAEPADAGIVPCELGPDATDRAAADDGQADLLALWFHVFAL
jgi:hypothetical protein